MTDRAQQWTCLGRNQTNQLWDLELEGLPQWIQSTPTVFAPPVYSLHPMHQIRALTLHAVDHQVCLDVRSGDGARDGAKVQLWRCLGDGQANQIWHPASLFP